MRLEIFGLAAVYERPTISPGRDMSLRASSAGRRTMFRRRALVLEDFVPLLANHDPALRLGTVVGATQTDRGLWIRAELDRRAGRFGPELSVRYECSGANLTVEALDDAEDIDVVHRAQVVEVSLVRRGASGPDVRWTGWRWAA